MKRTLRIKKQRSVFVIVDPTKEGDWEERALATFKRKRDAQQLLACLETDDLEGAWECYRFYAKSYSIDGGQEDDLFGTLPPITLLDGRVLIARTDAPGLYVMASPDGRHQLTRAPACCEPPWATANGHAFKCPERLPFSDDPEFDLSAFRHKFSVDPDEVISISDGEGEQVIATERQIITLFKTGQYVESARQRSQREQRERLRSY